MTDDDRIKALAYRENVTLRDQYGILERDRDRLQADVDRLEGQIRALKEEHDARLQALEEKVTALLR